MRSPAIPLQSRRRPARPCSHRGAPCWRPLFLRETAPEPVGLSRDLRRRAARCVLPRVCACSHLSASRMNECGGGGVKWGKHLSSHQSDGHSKRTVCRRRRIAAGVSVALRRRPPGALAAALRPKILRRMRRRPAEKTRRHPDNNPFLTRENNRARYFHRSQQSPSSAGSAAFCSFLIPTLPTPSLIAHSFPSVGASFGRRASRRVSGVRDSSVVMMSVGRAEKRASRYQRFRRASPPAFSSQKRYSTRARGNCSKTNFAPAPPSAPSEEEKTSIGKK